MISALLLLLLLSAALASCGRDNGASSIIIRSLELDSAQKEATWTQKAPEIDDKKTVSRIAELLNGFGDIYIKPGEGTETRVSYTLTIVNADGTRRFLRLTDRLYDFADGSEYFAPSETLTELTDLLAALFDDNTVRSPGNLEVPDASMIRSLDIRVEGAADGLTGVKVEDPAVITDFIERIKAVKSPEVQASANGSTRYGSEAYTVVVNRESQILDVYIIGSLLHSVATGETCRLPEGDALTQAVREILAVSDPT